MTDLDDDLIAAIDAATGEDATVESLAHDLGIIVADLNARVHKYRDALEWIVRLKDGPRDDAYRAAKEHAWERARIALAKSDTTEHHPRNASGRCTCGAWDCAKMTRREGLGEKSVRTFQERYDEERATYLRERGEKT